MNHTFPCRGSPLTAPEVIFYNLGLVREFTDYSKAHDQVCRQPSAILLYLYIKTSALYGTAAVHQTSISFCLGQVLELSCRMHLWLHVSVILRNNMSHSESPSTLFLSSLRRWRLSPVPLRACKTHHPSRYRPTTHGHRVGAVSWRPRTPSH